MTVAVYDDPEPDGDLEQFARLAIDLFKASRLIDVMSQPVDRPEKHPMVRVARQAIQQGRVQETRARLERQFKEELADIRDHRAVERRVIYILAVYDAAVRQDPIQLREAVRLVTKKRSEWTEAV